MNIWFSELLNVWIRLFFLLTPFFVLSMFMAMTGNMTVDKRRRIAIKTTVSIAGICIFLYFFGEFLFQVLGVTLDAFRIGAGIILLLSSISLINGKVIVPDTGNDDESICVVPLAIPFTIGPGTVGAMLVMGADQLTIHGRIRDCTGITAAIITVGLMLYAAPFLHRILGQKGLNVLSKLTGLMLSALAAQMIFSGIKNFLNL